MKKEAKRSFGSWNDIVDTYLPKYKSRMESQLGQDPHADGERVAEKLMNTVRGEMAKRLNGRRAAARGRRK